MISTEDRLATLERTVRFQRLALVGIVLAAGVAGLAGAAGNKEVKVDTLRAKKILVEGNEPTIRLQWSGDDEQFVELRSHKGGNGLAIAKGEYSVAVEAVDEWSTVRCRGPVGSIELESSDAAMVRALDAKESNRMMAGFNNKSGSAFGLLNRDGKLTWRAP